MIAEGCLRNHDPVDVTGCRALLQRAIELAMAGRAAGPLGYCSPGSNAEIIEPAPRAASRLNRRTAGYQGVSSRSLSERPSQTVWQHHPVGRPAALGHVKAC
jgi:hypothetical protein